MKKFLSVLALFFVFGLQPSFSEPTCPAGQIYASEVGICVNNSSSSSSSCKPGENWNSKDKKCVKCKSSQKWNKDKNKCENK